MMEFDPDYCEDLVESGEEDVYDAVNDDTFGGDVGPAAEDLSEFAANVSLNFVYLSLGC